MPRKGSLKELVSLHSKIVESPGVTGEIELRMGKYDTNGKFASEIGEFVYQSLLRSYTRSAVEAVSGSATEASVIHQEISLYSGEGDVSYKIIDENGVKTVTKKTKLMISENYNKNIRVALSEEEKLTILPKDAKFNMLKRRTRHSFVFSNLVADITVDTVVSSEDATNPTTKNPTTKNPTTKNPTTKNPTTKNEPRKIFQYELEILPSTIFEGGPPLRRGEEILRFLETLVGTTGHDMYALNKKQEIVDRFNSLVLSPVRSFPGKIPRTVGKKPKDLNVSDIPYLGEYVLYPKLDGIGYSLFFDDNGDGYLVNPSTVIYWIKNKYFAGTLIQGELIDSNEKHSIFVAYDIYFHKYKNVNPRSRKEVAQKGLPYERRNEMLREMKDGGYVVITAYPVRDYINFFTKLDNYNNDGIILTPHMGDKTFKWKPPNMLTIDFSVEFNKSMWGGGNEYTLYKEGGYGLLKHDTTVISDEDAKMIAPGHRYIPSSYIVEFNVHIATSSSFEGGGDISKGDRVYTPVRRREDKTKPNYMTVVNAIMNRIISNDLNIKQLYSYLNYVLYTSFALREGGDTNSIIANKLCKLYLKSHVAEIFDKAPKLIKDTFISVLIKEEKKNPQTYLQKKLLEHLLKD